MRLIQTTMLCAIAAVAWQLPAVANVTVEDSITVNAKPEDVWQALSQYQKEEKTFKKKIVSTKDDAVTIKEEFMSMPIVGTTYINYEEIRRKSENRVDYRLTGCKVLSKFEGSWLIEPKNDHCVTLKLVTDIDSWMMVPFKNKILRNTTKKGMEKRLAFVKQSAEQMTH